MAINAQTDAALAAHRFGLGEAALDRIAADPRAWLLGQVGPADPAWGAQLPSALDGLRLQYAYYRERRSVRAASDNRPQEQQFAEHFRASVEADLQSRLLSAVQSHRPFNERLVLFWANHFTVSMAKAQVRGLVGAFEREAIRPHVGGSFEAMLKAAVTHAAMLRYLDNAASAGPNSRLAQRRSRLAAAADGEMRQARVTGLNENLAREVLELHTLGVQGGYSQADVTALAALLTGWRVADPQRLDDKDISASHFDPSWHEPGSKTVLGRRYAEGPQALDQVLHDLTLHPSTARFVATKLARHFVGDEPPPALVDRLAQSFQRSGGQLPALYQTLIDAPEAWTPQLTKLKTPEEFVISSARLLSLGEAMLSRGRDGGISVMGQRVQAAPSPAGWPDRAEEWLGPEGVWKRVEWASRLAGRIGSRLDARPLAEASLGPLLSQGTSQQIARAADGQQALTLLLMSPEFQRR